jgi:hypothetical protein
MWVVCECYLLRVLLGLHVFTLQFLEKPILIILTSHNLRDFRLPLPSLSWNIMRRRLVVSYRCFGTTCQAHLQDQEVLCLILEFGTDRLSWNVGNYQYTLYNISEEPRFRDSPPLCFSYQNKTKILSVKRNMYYQQVLTTDTCFGHLL